MLRKSDSNALSTTPLRFQMEQQSNNDLADSTDWLQTALPAFAPLESALRCQVCKDFYDTPMITSCSHTFCSLCIRRCLSSDGKCPTCRAGDQASKLRRNWTVQEVAEAFKSSRPQALDLATKRQKSPGVELVSGKKRKRGATDETSSDGIQTRRSTRQARREQMAAIILDSDEGDKDFEPDNKASVAQDVEMDDGLVSCPICGRRMKEDLVNGHLDKCLKGLEDPSIDHKPKDPTSVNGRLGSMPKDGRSGTPTSKSPVVNGNVQTPTLARLPQLNYSLLKDQPLRKKLQELGIPSWGPRQLLIKRHTEWVDIFNSNSDSNRPRPVKALLKDLDTWEKSQGGSAPNNPFTNNATEKEGVMSKEFDTDGWKGRHKGQFDDLIAQARAKAKAQAQAKQANEDHSAESTTKSPSNGVRATTLPPDGLAEDTEMKNHSSSTPEDHASSASVRSKETPEKRRSSVYMPDRPSLSAQSTTSHNSPHPELTLNTAITTQALNRARSNSMTMPHNHEGKYPESAMAARRSSRCEALANSPVANMFAVARDSIPEEEGSASASPAQRRRSTTNGIIGTAEPGVSPPSSSLSNGVASPALPRKIPMFSVPEASTFDFDGHGNEMK